MRFCGKCNCQMVEDCGYSGTHRGETVPPSKLKTFIRKGNWGLLKTDGIETEIKVALCPNCGTVEFYVENPKRFERFLENEQK